MSSEQELKEALEAYQQQVKLRNILFVKFS